MASAGKAGSTIGAAWRALETFSTLDWLAGLLPAVGVLTAMRELHPGWFALIAFVAMLVFPAMVHLAREHFATKRRRKLTDAVYEVLSWGFQVERVLGRTFAGSEKPFDAAAFLRVFPAKRLEAFDELWHVHQAGRHLTALVGQFAQGGMPEAKSDELDNPLLRRLRWRNDLSVRFSGLVAECYETGQREGLNLESSVDFLHRVERDLNLAL